MTDLTRTDPPWLVTSEKIDAAVHRIVEIAHPARVILFGSAARGDLHRDSDADFLVVVDRPGNTRQESVRIRRALSDINMAMDIIVVEAARLQELADRPGLIYGEAVRGGRVVYDRAA